MHVIQLNAHIFNRWEFSTAFYLQGCSRVILKQKLKAFLVAIICILYFFFSNSFWLPAAGGAALEISIFLLLLLLLLSSFTQNFPFLSKTLLFTSIAKHLNCFALLWHCIGPCIRTALTLHLHSIDTALAVQ